MDQNEDSPWQYKPDGGEPEPDAGQAPTPSEPTPHKTAAGNVAWQAAEFVEHTHGPGWYIGLLGATLGIALLTYFITKDYFATGVIVALGMIVWAYAGHKPSVANYEITSSGLKVNQKNYSFSLFKSFAVFDEGNLKSVNLMPIKRLMPPVSAYFDPSEEQKITQALGEYLPYEPKKMDGIDRLTRRLRL